MKEIKILNVVEITKLNENINLVDKKITFQSNEIWKDIQKTIIKEGEGIYKVKYCNKIEYWFYVNYNTMYVYEKEMTNEEIKGYINYLNNTYK